MIDYSNMIYEIIEALEEKYSGEELATCMVYLHQTLNRVADQNIVYNWLYEHGYCPWCGEELEYQIERNVHDELPDNAVEILKIPYCRNCGEV